MKDLRAIIEIKNEVEFNGSDAEWLKIWNDFRNKAPKHLDLVSFIKTAHQEKIDKWGEDYFIQN